MKRLLVTGADGFVGRWLVRAARADGIQVVASILPMAPVPEEWSGAGQYPPVEVVRADLREAADVGRMSEVPVDAVAHLAAIASSAAAWRDPATAIRVNQVGTALLGDALVRAGRPRLLFVSTAEVYGPRHAGPIPETAPPDPASPYAASKAAAEAIGARWAADGLPVIIARAFPHTGPGQGASYVIPALAGRLSRARRTGSPSVPAGNLDAIRDFLDVRDVVRAYLLLLRDGRPGEVYNVASGVGRRLSDCFALLARIVGVAARAEQDASLLRPGDIPVLIGDATKLRTATGWSPAIPFERTLEDVVHAQAD